MRVLELPAALTVTLDILVWLVLHMGISYLVTRAPAPLFRPSWWLFKPRRWEREGRLYEVLFLVRRWKAFLPDGAAFFRGGFRKRELARRDRDYLRQFVRETCRAELAHWATMLCGPGFLLWNRWEVGVGLIGYGIAANLPCIITQRYNRLRLTAVLDR